MKKAIIMGSALISIVSGISLLIRSHKRDKYKGSFRCHYCNTLFRPNMFDYTLSFHTSTRRRLPCPVCGKIGMFKHVNDEPTVNNEYDLGIVTSDDAKIFQDYLDNT